jgi:hypothetical protein
MTLKLVVAAPGADRLANHQVHLGYARWGTRKHQIHPVRPRGPQAPLAPLDFSTFNEWPSRWYGSCDMGARAWDKSLEATQGPIRPSSIIFFTWREPQGTQELVGYEV